MSIYPLSAFGVIHNPTKTQQFYLEAPFLRPPKWFSLAPCNFFSFFIPCLLTCWAKLKKRLYTFITPLYHIQIYQ